MKPWKRIEPTVVSKVGYRTVVSKTFVQPSGKTQSYQSVAPEYSHCIATVALTPDNRVIIARQFRPGPEKIMDELPGGGAEAHDDHFEAAARRELLEETGYEADAMLHLGDVYKDAYSNSIWHFFLATGCKPHPDGQQLDETEFVELKLITIDELFDNARNGRMTDASAVFLAYEQLMKLKEGND